MARRALKDAVLSIIGVVVCVILIPPLLAGIWLEKEVGIPLWLTATVFVVIAVKLIVNSLFKEIAAQGQRLRAIQISNIDSMTGIEFEHYLRRVLASQGYDVRVTRASGDLGVDLVAVRGGNAFAIQAKRYQGKVSRRAISDAVAGMVHYGCNRAMVVTNSYFTPGAVTLARSTNCILVDRDELVRWIMEFQNSDGRL